MTPKNEWLVAALLMVCCMQKVYARSATSTYQQQNVNGIAAGPAGSGGGGSGTLKEPLAEAGTSTTAIWSDLGLVYKLYKQCASDNLSVCLKVKLLTGLEKTLRKVTTLKILDGVQFIKSVESMGTLHDEDQPNAILSEKDIEAVLPRGLEAKEHLLNNMIFKKLIAFLQDHTLQVKFPDLPASHSNGDNSVESRKKKDKKGGGGAYIMIPLLLGGTFVPIAYGALAMLAGKALIVSKLALVLASIIGIKKLLSSGGGKESQHEVVVSSGGHSGWGRDFDLAYSGWKPTHDSDKTM